MRDSDRFRLRKGTVIFRLRTFTHIPENRRTASLECKRTQKWRFINKTSESSALFMVFPRRRFKLKKRNVCAWKICQIQNILFDKIYSVPRLALFELFSRFYYCIERYKKVFILISLKNLCRKHFCSVSLHIYIYIKYTAKHLSFFSPKNPLFFSVSESITVSALRPNWIPRWSEDRRKTFRWTAESQSSRVSHSSSTYADLSIGRHAGIFSHA